MESSIDKWMNSANGYRKCILNVRKHVANAIRVNEQDIVLVDNASEATNDVIRNFEPPLSTGQYIVDLSTAYAPFHGFYQWMGERHGVKILQIPITWPVTGDESFIVPVQSALAEAKQNGLNLRVAIISHISAYPSVILPVKQLVEAFHAYFIPVVIDGAHAMGNIPVHNMFIRIVCEIVYVPLSFDDVRAFFYFFPSFFTQG